MEKHGTAILSRAHKSTGLVMMLREDLQETTDYIKIKSVNLHFYGELLTPTSYDAHGNPRIDGIAALVLIWKIRQKVRDGELESEYNALIDYSYITTDGAFVEIPLENRMPQSDVCPVCGKKFTINEFDYDSVELEGYHWAAHQKCAKWFTQMKIIDETTDAVHLAFDSYAIDKKNRFAWGKGEHNMSYALMSTECGSLEDDCSNRLWFMFHTPIGDIKIGRWKYVITIEFMDNFHEFDMATFDIDKDMKCFVGNEPRRRMVTVCDIEKMHECLCLVQNAVLPNKT
jgi:hypothetical protein